MRGQKIQNFRTLLQGCMWTPPEGGGGGDREVSKPHVYLSVHVNIHFVQSSVGYILSVTSL